MNKKELIDALESLGMRPGRGLGQNFLLDSNLLDWIVRNSGAAAGENILEVGPGFGALTEKMVDAGFNGKNLPEKIISSSSKPMPARWISMNYSLPG